MRFQLTCLLLLSALGAGCVSTKPVIVGQTHVAIAADQVKIYASAPPTFQEIAKLTASSKSVFSPGGPQQVDKVVQRLKEQAAQLGANGLILEGFSDRETASLGTGVGSESYSRNTSVGVGVGGSFGVFKKTGQARAIFVPPT